MISRRKSLPAASACVGRRSCISRRDGTTSRYCWRGGSPGNWTVLWTNYFSLNHNLRVREFLQGGSCGQSDKLGVDVRLAESANGSPVHVDQPNHLASVGKLFTATVIAMLKERGELDFTGAFMFYHPGTESHIIASLDVIQFRPNFTASSFPVRARSDRYSCE